MDLCSRGHSLILCGEATRKGTLSPKHLSRARGDLGRILGRPEIFVHLTFPFTPSNSGAVRLDCCLRSTTRKSFRQHNSYAPWDVVGMFLWDVTLMWDCGGCGGDVETGPLHQEIDRHFARPLVWVLNKPNLGQARS